MIDYGARHIQGAHVAQPRAQVQIDILAVHHQVFVEQLVVLGERFQRHTAVGGGASAWPEHFLHRIILAGVALPDAAIARHTVDTIEVAGRVDMVALVEQQQLAGGKRVPRKALQCTDELFEPVWVCFGVVVQQHDIIPASGMKGSVHCRGQAAIGWQPKHLHFGILACQQLTGLVGRTVVDHHNTEVATGLAAQRIQAGWQKRGAIIVGDDDVDHGWLNV